MRKKPKKKKIKRLIGLVLFFVLLLYAASTIDAYFRDREMKTLQSELKDEDMEEQNEVLIKDQDRQIGEGEKFRNPDYIGWLFIEGTNIDYPVLNGKKYFRRNFENKYALAGNPFVDGYQQGQDLVTIFGHNMGFGREDFFQNVLKYKDVDYFNNHSTVYFSQPGSRENKYQVLAYLEYQIKDLNTFNFNQPYFINNENFDEWQANMLRYVVQENSVFRELNYEDGNFIVLSTCHSPTWREDGIRSLLLCYKPNEKEGL